MFTLWCTPCTRHNQSSSHTYHPLARAGPARHPILPPRSRHAALHHTYWPDGCVGTGAARAGAVAALAPREDQKHSGPPYRSVMAGRRPRTGRRAATAAWHALRAKPAWAHKHADMCLEGDPCALSPFFFLFFFFATGFFFLTFVFYFILSAGCCCCEKANREEHRETRKDLHTRVLHACDLDALKTAQPASGPVDLPLGSLFVSPRLLRLSMRLVILALV